MENVVIGRGFTCKENNMEKKLPYLNAGCGYHFHEDWTNIDFTSTGKDVIGYNLLNGIPFPDNTFEVVYHSHVLEHFSKNGGRLFVKECYRVLKKGGTLRIAVPDLHRIVEEYMRLFNALKENSEDAYLQACYNWILLEMYDQVVRGKSGGDMVQFLAQETIINEDFVLQRCGFEVKSIIEALKRNVVSNESLPKKPGILKRLRRFPSKLRSLPPRIKNKLIKKLLGNEYAYLELGRFRSHGEIHQWMYDEVSLTRLLHETGFNGIQVCQGVKSRIKDWEKFGLETIDGKIRKPDSLFIECTK